MWVIFSKKIYQLHCNNSCSNFFVYLVPPVGEILWVSLKSKCIALSSLEGKKKGWVLAC